MSNVFVGWPWTSGASYLAAAKNMIKVGKDKLLEEKALNKVEAGRLIKEAEDAVADFQKTIEALRKAHEVGQKESHAAAETAGNMATYLEARAERAQAAINAL